MKSCTGKKLILQPCPQSQILDYRCLIGNLLDNTPLCFVPTYCNHRRDENVEMDSGIKVDWEVRRNKSKSRCSKCKWEN